MLGLRSQANKLPISHETRIVSRPFLSRVHEVKSTSNLQNKSIMRCQCERKAKTWVYRNKTNFLLWEMSSILCKHLIALQVEWVEQCLVLCFPCQCYSIENPAIQWKKRKKKPLRPDIKFHLIWKYSYKSYIRLKKPLWTIVRQSPSLSRLLGHYKLLLKLMGVNIACMSQMHTRLLLMCAFANIKVNKKKRFVSVLKL